MCGGCDEQTELSECARWPMCRTTHRGRKQTKLSNCAPWPMCPTTHCGRKKQTKLGENAPSAMCRTTPCSPKQGLSRPQLQNSAGASQERPSNSFQSIESSGNPQTSNANHSLRNSEIINDSIGICSRARSLVKQRNHRNHHCEREPSRIFVRKLNKILKNKKYRKRIQMAGKSLPKSSLLKCFCNNYKMLSVRYGTEHFYSKYVFFMKNNKCNGLKKSLTCTCNCRCTARHQNNCTSGIHDNLKGGMNPENTQRSIASWHALAGKLAVIGLLPYDVGAAGDCFFKSVSHQLYGNANLHFHIRMAGILHMNTHPELYIESFLRLH